LDAEKRTEEIILEKSFEKKKKKRGIEFKPSG